MSAPELLYGGRAADTFPAPRAELAAIDRRPIQLSDVEIYYSLFELPMASVLPRLPQSLHPSVPAVMATSFWHCASSPFGPFGFAYVGLACRTGIKPRHLVTGAWCDNPAAAEMFAQRYGIACDAAAVYCRESYDRVRGAVSIDGATPLEVITTDLVAITGGGGTVKYSPTLGLARVNGAAALVQFEAAYSFKRVLRGKVAAPIFDAAALGDAAVRPHYPVAGTYAVCDCELMPPRFSVDLARPAEAGGAQKIEQH